MSDWSAGQPPRGRRPQRQGGYDYYRGARPAPPPGQHPGEAPPRRPDGPGRPPEGGPPAPPPRKKKRWGRWIGIALLALVLLLGGLVAYFDSMLQRTPALGPGGTDSAGTNWLLVGSDSREGLDEGQRDELSAGDSAGRRTDTMMLVHIPSGGGKPALISLPRDSYVPVPGQGRDKLNSAFAYGGPKLLSQTVQESTGVHVDHYAEIGLGGFSDLVSAVGGVDMCVDEPMRDPKAGLDLKPGCQELDGNQALGFVRTRDSAKGDLDRVDNQRKLLGALVNRATSPTTLLNPFRLFPLASGASKTFLVNDGDHVWHLASLALAMGDISSGQGITTTVPLAGFGEDDSGQSVIKWDRQEAATMFDSIAKDQPIPPDVLPDK